MLTGPGPLVQVFRINSTRGPFKNAKFRQAFNHLMDRDAILRAGYAGLGQVVALPWAPASPAHDPAYIRNYAFNIDKAKELLAQSGLSAAEMSAWKLVVNAGSQPDVTISQIVQNTLKRVGITIELDMKEGSELVDAMLQGRFDALFGGVGNIQKFPRASPPTASTAREQPRARHAASPSRICGGDRPGEHDRGSQAEVKAAYDNLNKVLVEAAFGIPTNTYDQGIIVTAKNVTGFTLDMDNMLVLRTTGFRK